MAAESPETREQLRARIAHLQEQLRAALAERKSRIRAIVAICRAERAALGEEFQHRRKQALAQVELDVRSARAGARLVRLSRLAEARKGADSDIVAARAAIAVERQHQDTLRRIEADLRRQRAEVHRMHEVSAQGVMLHSAVLGGLAPLLQRESSKVRPLAGESPAAALLRYAQTHPAEAHAAVEPRAEMEIARTREELARARLSLRNAPRTPKAKATNANRAGPLVSAAGRAPAAPTPTTGKVTPRRPGQLPRGRGGMLLTNMLRERDSLAKKSSAKSKARPVAGSQRMRPATKNSPAIEKPRTAPAALPSPKPAAAAALAQAPSRTEKTVKAPEVHDTAKIAAMIRQDIKAAVGAHQLPKAKYSVTTSKYSMGSSIDVVVSGLPFPVFNENAFAMDGSTARFDSVRFRSRFTPEADAVQRKLEEIVGAYHWDRSDPQTDYYDVRFHKDIRLDTRGEMERITRALQARAPGAAPAARTTPPVAAPAKGAAPSAPSTGGPGAKVIPLRPRPKTPVAQQALFANVQNAATGPLAPGDRVQWAPTFLQNGRKVDPRWYEEHKADVGTVDSVQRDGDVLVLWDGADTTTIHPRARLVRASK